MAKGPESAQQCRLHSLGVQRDRELSMRAHMLQKKQKELQNNWLQKSTGVKSTCQSIAQQLPGISIFKPIYHWNSKENLSQNHRFSITFGHLLDPWTPSGRDLAAKGKPSEFWTPFLLDFWWIMGALGHPLDHLWQKNCKKWYLGHLFLRFWKRSSNNTEFYVISDPLQPSRLALV